MAEKEPCDSSPDTDRDFEPSADMLVHEYDDEQTLDEEERFSNSDAGSNELDALQKEGDMPIEDLMAVYGYGSGSPEAAGGDPESRASSSGDDIISNQDLTLDKDQIARDLLKDDDDDSNKETSVNELMDSVDVESETHRLLRSANSQGGSSDDDSEDDDYQPVPDEDWKKTISVGSDYQAQIPATLQKYSDAPPYENEDRLLWDPSKREDKEVETYLREVQESNLSSSQGLQAIPQGSHIRDDEQALYLLLQCGHEVEEASRRRKMQSVQPADPMSLWSEEECRNFETGLKMYGKDFYIIQQNKVRTRSVGELVQFYYLWKKTERHDVFTNKNRLEKKKYALHPGVTDYMDRFLDEQENPTPVGASSSSRERSSSPSMNSLMYADPKRHQQAPPHPVTGTPSSPHVDLPTIVEMVQKVVHPQELERLSSELSTSATSSASLPGATTISAVVTSSGHTMTASGDAAVLPTFTEAPPPTAVATVPSPPSTPPEDTIQSPPPPPQSRKRDSPMEEDREALSAKRIKSADVEIPIQQQQQQQQQHTNGLEKSSHCAASVAVSSIIDSAQAAAFAAVASMVEKSQQQQQQPASSSGGPPPSTSPPVAAASD